MTAFLRCSGLNELFRVHAADANKHRKSRRDEEFRKEDRICPARKEIFEEVFQVVGGTLTPAKLVASHKLLAGGAQNA